MASEERSARRRFAQHLWLVVLAPVFGGVAVAVVVALLVEGWRPWEPDGPTRTEVRLFASGAGSGLPTGIYVDRTLSGRCNYESNVDPAPEARRCIGEHFILDPCFGYGTELICVSSPWTKTGVRFHVREYTFFLDDNRIVDWDPTSTKPMPMEPEFPEDVTKSGRPWAVELANGHRCIFVSGATFTVAGQRGNYQCSKSDGFNGGYGAWIIGTPDHSTQPWVASFLPAKASQTIQVAVEVAWY